MDYSDNRNGVLFCNKILSRIRPGNTILDLGAGAGISRQMNFRGLTGRVCCIDPSENVKVNPFPDEGRVGLREQNLYGVESIRLLGNDRST